MLPIILVLVVGTVGLAQQDGSQYNVKFVCGRSNGEIIGPGTYHTAINILNANKDSVNIQSIISVALPGSPGIITAPGSFALRLNQSIEIDCPEIDSLTSKSERIRTRNKFRKGFVIVKSSEPLEIVAVYTATGKDGMVESIHSERVPSFWSRTNSGCPDLAVGRLDTAIINYQQIVAKVIVKNVGSVATTQTEAKLTYGPATGERFTRVTIIPPLEPGESTVVSFTIHYTSSNPEVYFHFLADHANLIMEECREDNNSNEIS